MSTIDIERAVANVLMWGSPTERELAVTVEPEWVVDPWCRGVVGALRELTTDRTMDTPTDRLRAVHRLLVRDGLHRDEQDVVRLNFSRGVDGNGQFRSAPGWIDELEARFDRRRIRCQLAAALIDLEAGRPVEQIRRRILSAAAA